MVQIFLDQVLRGACFSSLSRCLCLSSAFLWRSGCCLPGGVLGFHGLASNLDLGMWKLEQLGGVKVWRGWCTITGPRSSLVWWLWLLHIWLISSHAALNSVPASPGHWNAGRCGQAPGQSKKNFVGVESFFFFNLYTMLIKPTNLWGGPVLSLEMGLIL